MFCMAENWRKYFWLFRDHAETGKPEPNKRKQKKNKIPFENATLTNRKKQNKTNT